MLPLKRKPMNKRGTVMLYITFMILAVIIVVIAAVFAPMGVLFNTKMYEAGEDIMLKANASISGINDATVRDHIQDTIQSGLSAQQNNIDVNGAIFQYGWVFVVIITGLVVFIFARRLVEYGGSLV